MIPLILGRADGSDVLDGRKGLRLSSSTFPTVARRAITDEVQVDVTAFVEFAVGYMLPKRHSDYDTAIFESTLNTITRPDLVKEYGC